MSEHELAHMPEGVREGGNSPSRRRQALAPLYNPTNPKLRTIHIAERLGVLSTLLASSP